MSQFNARGAIRFHSSAMLKNSARATGQVAEMSVVPMGFLIVEPTHIVALDIAEAIRAAIPAARVVIAGALDTVDPGQLPDRLRLAFVHAAPAVFDGSPLAAEIARRGGAVVLMGDGAEEAAAAAPGVLPVLVRPFTSADIMAHLDRAGLAPDGAPQQA